MAKIIKVIVKNEDYVGQKYSEPLNCPLFRAIKRALNESGIDLKFAAGCGYIHDGYYQEFAKFGNEIGKLYPAFDLLDFQELTFAISKGEKYEKR